MKQIISKCDKCKRQTDILIDISIANTHEKIEKINVGVNNTSVLNSFWGIGEQHPTFRAELCRDCTCVLFHWLGHPENSFIRERIEINE